MTAQDDSDRPASVLADTGRARAAVRLCGRFVLWAAVAVVLVRGLGAIAAGDSREPVAGSAVTDGGIGDGEAGAFAIRFARAYLEDPSVAPGRPARAYLAAGVADDAADTDGSKGVSVGWAVVAREASVGEGRRLVTVAAGVAGGRSLYLTVPVARDPRGALAVYDLPSFTAPPAVAVDSAEPAAPLSGAGSRAIADLTTRFLRAYLAGGDEAKLAYFLAPSARITQMPVGLEVAEIGGIDEVETAGSGRTVIASVSVRDVDTGARYALRYRLDLVREDRWHVAAVAGGPQS